MTIIERVPQLNYLLGQIAEVCEGNPRGNPDECRHRMQYIIDQLNGSIFSEEDCLELLSAINARTAEAPKLDRHASFIEKLDAALIAMKAAVEAQISCYECARAQRRAIDTNFALGRLDAGVCSGS